MPKFIYIIVEFFLDIWYLIEDFFLIFSNPFILIRITTFSDGKEKGVCAELEMKIEDQEIVFFTTFFGFLIFIISDADLDRDYPITITTEFNNKLIKFKTKLTDFDFTYRGIHKVIVTTEP